MQGERRYRLSSTGYPPVLKKCSNTAGPNHEHIQDSSQDHRPEVQQAEAYRYWQSLPVGDRLSAVWDASEAWVYVFSVRCDLDAIASLSDDKDFEVVARAVGTAIENNRPEDAPDRLHAFVTTFMRFDLRESRSRCHTR
jgi:hypothetical protein